MRPRQRRGKHKKQFTPPPLRAALGGTGGSVNCFLARRAFFLIYLELERTTRKPR